MAKFYGEVGYAITTEKTIDNVPTGVWEDVITEKSYYGDVLKYSTRWQSGDKVNDDLTVSNSISIMADAFAYQYFSAIKYVKWMGVTWKVVNVEVQRPRLILSLGGEYNG